MTTIQDLRTAADLAIQESRATRDPDRPIFHLAPPVGRLNDPNGLVVVDGVYHAFYQFGPFFPVDRTIYWGHATSTDLLTWQQHAPAIVPDSSYDRNGAYSGGAYVHDGEVWLHYTGNVKDGDVRTATQCAVTSSDLETFTKHPGNPLIPGPPAGYTSHFRDPMVFAHDAGGFRMCLGAQREDLTGCVLLYRSPDLTHWTLEGELRFPGADLGDFGFMWECPNLIRVPDERTGELHDVLIFCPQGVGPDGEYFRNVDPCGYLVGRLEGRDFHIARPFTELDRGFEFYAPQTFHRPTGSDAGPDADPDADMAPLLLGWLGNPSEDDLPSLESYGWVHTLSIARRLTLRDGHLHQRPVIVPDGPRTVTCRASVAGTVLRDGSRALDELAGRDTYALHLEVDQAEAADWTVTLRSGDSGVELRFDHGHLTVDRSRTRYPHGGRRTVSVPADSVLTVDVVHDRSVTEVFVGDGHTSFSMRSFLADGPLTTELSVTGTLVVRDAATTLIS